MKMQDGRLKINTKFFFSNTVKQWRASGHRTL